MIIKNIITIFCKTVILLCAIVIALPVLGYVTQAEADKREKNLKNAVTPTDSLKILFDVYELSDKLNKGRITSQIIDIAKRTDNSEAISELIKELSGSTDDTRDLARLIEISENLPENSDMKSKETITEMEFATSAAKGLKGNDLENRVIEHVKKGMNISQDPYEEIANIYKALAFLGSYSQGPMYLSYILRLGELVDKLPEKDHAIKNLYYTTAALYFTRKRDYKKAIDADRQLIKQLDVISQHLPKDSVSTQALDYYYYISYRRMLRNFMGLNPDEVEDIYAKCLELVDKSEDVSESFNNVGLTNSYYYMATGKYDKAIPELKKALQSNSISKFRKAELSGLLALAYRETGDEKNELPVLRDYTMQMAEDRNNRMNDVYKELELQNNVNKIIAEEFKAQQKDRQSNITMRKTAVTIVYILALVLIFLCRGYFKLKNKVKLLEAGNKKLRTNIEQIIDDGMPSGTQDLRHLRNGLKG